jgi:hypothetical protein
MREWNSLGVFPVPPVYPEYCEGPAHFRGHDDAQKSRQSPSVPPRHS